MAPFARVSGSGQRHRYAARPVSIKYIFGDLIIPNPQYKYIDTKDYLLYDKILIDVDNNQSIKDSLSTFSAHLSTINEIRRARAREEDE